MANANANPAGNASAPAPAHGKASKPAAVPLAPPAAAPAAAPAPAPAVAVVAVALGNSPVAVVAGTLCTAAGVAFVAPCNGQYSASKANNGWPCAPGAGYVVQGTYNAPGAPAAPATVLVLPKAAAAGTVGNGCAPGQYRVWPYYGAHSLTVVAK